MKAKKAPKAPLHEEGWFNLPESPIREEVKFNLVKISLQHGMDAKGLWYGPPNDLWEATAEGKKPMRIRAADRLAAREELRHHFPRAKFFR